MAFRPDKSAKALRGLVAGKIGRRRASESDDAHRDDLRENTHLKQKHAVVGFRQKESALRAWKTLPVVRVVSSNKSVDRSLWHHSSAEDCKKRMLDSVFTPQYALSASLTGVESRSAESFVLSWATVRFGRARTCLDENLLVISHAACWRELNARTAECCVSGMTLNFLQAACI